MAFWEAQPDQYGVEWHRAKYLSEVEVEDGGVAVYVDVQSLMPGAFRLRLPKDAEQVVIAVAYYGLEPPAARRGVSWR